MAAKNTFGDRSFLRRSTSQTERHFKTWMSKTSRRFEPRLKGNNVSDRSFSELEGSMGYSVLYICNSYITHIYIYSVYTLCYCCSCVMECVGYPKDPGEP